MNEPMHLRPRINFARLKETPRSAEGAPGPEMPAQRAGPPCGSIPRQCADRRKALYPPATASEERGLQTGPVATAREGSVASIWLGNGDGSFHNLINDPGSARPRRRHVRATHRLPDPGRGRGRGRGRFQGDGRMDLLFIGTTTSTRSVGWACPATAARMGPTSHPWRFGGVIGARPVRLEERPPGFRQAVIGARAPHPAQGVSAMRRICSWPAAR
jgi:hypothetical protein